MMRRQLCVDNKQYLLPLGSVRQYRNQICYNNKLKWFKKNIWWEHTDHIHTLSATKFKLTCLQSMKNMEFKFN